MLPDVWLLPHEHGEALDRDHAVAVELQLVLPFPSLRYARDRGAFHRRDEPLRCGHLLHARESVFHFAAIALAFRYFGFRFRGLNFFPRSLLYEIKKCSISSKRAGLNCEIFRI